jgi:hypothetical protein
VLLLPATARTDPIQLQAAIVSAFIQENGEHCVNISHNQRVDVMQRADEGYGEVAEPLEAAQQEAKKLMLQVWFLISNLVELLCV